MILDRLPCFTPEISEVQWSNDNPHSVARLFTQCAKQASRRMKWPRNPALEPNTLRAYVIRHLVAWNISTVRKLTVCKTCTLKVSLPLHLYKEPHKINHLVLYIVNHSPITDDHTVNNVARFSNTTHNTCWYLKMPAISCKWYFLSWHHR